MDRIVVFLHVAAMFAAVGVSVVPEISMHRLADKGDVRGVRSFGGVFRSFARSIPILFLGGTVLGLIAVALIPGYDYTQMWLDRVRAGGDRVGPRRGHPGTVG